MDSVYSINMERAVLSSILFEPSLMDDIQNMLKSHDYYLPAHQKIYETLIKLHTKGMPLDEEFIRKYTSTKDVDDSIIIEIVSATPISNPMGYVKEIKDAAVKRELASLATTIKKVSIEEDVSADDALVKVGQEYDKICDSGNSDSFKPMVDLVNEFYTQFQASKDKPIGFPTGFAQLDRAGVVFEPGDLIVIGARPSMGKTSFLATMKDEYLNKHNIGVLFDSLETPADKYIRRLVAAINEESLSDLKRGLVKDPNKFKTTLSFLQNTKNLIIHDKSFVPIEYLRAKARRIFRKNPHIKIWMIDHLKFVKSLGRDRVYEVGQITKELKAIGKEFGVAVVLLSQLARPKDKSNVFRPSLSDLRESGSVEEDADIVILLHRESYYKRNEKNNYEKPVNEAELIIAKYRDGQSSIVKTQFNGPYGKFGIFPEVSYTSIEQSNDAFSSGDDSVSIPGIDMG